MDMVVRSYTHMEIILVWVRRGLRRLKEKVFMSDG
jgi:hypothetical protein